MTIYYLTWTQPCTKYKMMIKYTTVSRFLLILLSLLLFGDRLLFAQINYTGSLGNATLGVAGWVKAGTLAIPQQGISASIRIYGGVGFNGQTNQMGFTELFIRTSNGSSLVDGFAFSAYASRSGRHIGAVNGIKILPNAAGAAATAYDIYFNNGSYIGMGTYQVNCAYGSWTHTMTLAADPGAEAYNVPFEFRTLNETYLAGSLFVSGTNGNVGIGTVTPNAKLAVYGDIFATKVKVTQTGWPDYVFGKDYHLPEISALEQYISAHQHLPEIPSAMEVAKDGLDLGDMNKRLLQKVEELSLYIIQLDKKNKELESRLKVVERANKRTME
jgi:hypothetical protein